MTTLGSVMTTTTTSASGTTTTSSSGTLPFTGSGNVFLMLAFALLCLDVGAFGLTASKRGRRRSSPQRRIAQSAGLSGLMDYQRQQRRIGVLVVILCLLIVVLWRMYRPAKNAGSPSRPFPEARP